MHEVIVLGGYGRFGRYCVHQLAENTRVGIVVAGPNAQRAESFALQYPGRARAAYANSDDRRTLERLLEGAAMVVSCSGGHPRELLDVCLQLRVPFLGVTPVRLAQRERDRIGELAWQANLPVVLQAGAIPGLPGVLAEALVRRFPTIPEVRVASTGPWCETETSLRDSRAFARESEPATGSSVSRFMPLRWDFEPPVGARPMRVRSSADLERFVETHCVDKLIYLEPSFPSVTRGLERLRRREPGRFALAAEALLDPESGKPDACIEIGARHPLLPASIVVRVLVSARLAGKLPAGLLTPREAINPALMLAALEKSGVQVGWD